MPDSLKALMGASFAPEAPDAAVPGAGVPDTQKKRKLKKVKGSEVLTDGNSFFIADEPGAVPYETQEEAEKALAKDQAGNKNAATAAGG